MKKSAKPTSKINPKLMAKKAATKGMGYAC